MNFLSRGSTVAGPGFNRWFVPPAAISVHMCIGEVYGFSVFNVPLTQAGAGWTIPEVGWIYSIALFMLGLSAAVFGRWVERVGPRKTMVASCLCFCGGLLISALGVQLKMLWLLYLGYGLTGGIGLGLGYISPVSTLIKWFPDRPGMAILYAVFMLFGALVIRVPAEGWKPVGFEPKAHARPMITQESVTASVAWRTPPFWCLWVVLCMNVTAGIGILGQASKMCSDMFGVSPAVGAGFAGLLSIFNMGGRFVWSSVSDVIGRRQVYCIYFVLGAAMYCSIPWTQMTQNKLVFVALTAIIISMYGGGFATIPAYLRDLFGSREVGAIHGRLITAWSVAALVGPGMVNYISTARMEAGVPKAEAYNLTMYLMAGLLGVGLIANLLVRPVDPKHHATNPPKG